MPPICPAKVTVPGACSPPPLASSLLPLIALSIVYRSHPQWLCISLADAAQSARVSAQRVSRLTTRALPRFEALLATLTQRGRPATLSPPDPLQREHAITQALFEVATALLQYLPRRKKEVRDLVMGAYQRLQKSHLPLTQRDFCEALHVPTRTLRSWLRRPSKSVSPPSKPQPKRKPRNPRGPRRHRFDFDVVLPDTQFAADTTQLKAFGVSLKLIAAQDVGGRDQNLLDSVIIDDHESAELVVQVLQEALKDNPGAQAITDQGTPYMAKDTCQALKDLNVEHAPQREGEPTGKATVERAFRTIKDIAKPILHISNELAEKCDDLRDNTLAVSSAKILMGALLKAYQAGGRAVQRSDKQREGINVQQLANLAEQHRNQARKTDTSARLLLEHIHQVYNLQGSAQAFVNALRIYPVRVLQEAEKLFSTQVHRDDIKDRNAYFAAIVRRVHKMHKQQRASEDSLDEQRQLREDDIAKSRQLFEQWAREPVQALDAALKAMTAQWLPKKKQLIARGAGAPRSWMRQALRKLAELHSPNTALDMAHGVFQNFELRFRQEPDADPAVIPAIRQVFEQVCQEQLKPPDIADCISEHTFVTLLGTDRNSHSPPPQPLWN